MDKFESLNKAYDELDEQRNMNLQNYKVRLFLNQSTISKSKDEVLQLSEELESLQEIIKERELRTLQKQSLRMEEENRRTVELEISTHLQKARSNSTDSFDSKGFKELSEFPASPQKGRYTSSANYQSYKFGRLAKTKKKTIKRRRPVLLEDISHVGDDLVIKFQHERISLEDLNVFFENAANRDDELSLCSLKSLLAEKPFELVDKKYIELVARYLVEDNYDDMVAIEEQQTAPVTIVKSIVRNFLKQYELIPLQQVHFRSIKIAKTLGENYLKLSTEFGGMKNKTGEFCSKEKLLSVFDKNEVFFEVKELGIVLGKLYAVTKDTERLPFTQLFELFGAKNLNFSSSRVFN